MVTTILVFLIISAIVLAAFLLKKNRSRKEKLVAIIVAGIIAVVIFPLVKIIAGFFTEGSYRVPKDLRVPLFSEKENKVKITDTLVIFTSSCKGCASETTYKVYDSLGIIKQVDYKQIDLNPDADGGSYSVELELLPLKEGKTKLKLFSYSNSYSDENSTVDSAYVSEFSVTVSGK